MAKLFTDHDHFHSHAIVGALALLHFLWRFIQLLRFGTSFPDEHHEPRWFQTAGVMVHLLLPLLSFQFPLPQKRNMNKPMIWNEGRLHSLIFAIRHIIVTLGVIWGIFPNFSIDSQQLKAYSADWYVALVTEIIAKQALVLGTCLAARIVTDKYGDTKNRTTNSMPYPRNVSLDSQLIIKHGYATKQFIATSLCLLGDPTAAFWPLIAIQGAVFLMTLVRKGIISAATYHRVYALQLYFNTLIFPIRVMHGSSAYDQIFAAMVGVHVSCRLRFRFGYSAVECWTIGVMAYVIGRAVIGDWVNQAMTANVWSHRIGVLLALLGCIPKEELLLFFGSSYHQTLSKSLHIFVDRSEAFHPSIEKEKPKSK